MTTSKTSKTSNSKSPEFTRFEKLAKDLLSVPKKDIQEREKKAAKTETRKERS